MIEKLREIERRFNAIDADFENPDVISNPKELERLGRTRAELEPIVTAIREYDSVVKGISEAEEMVADPEMRELAYEELNGLKARLPDLEQQLRLMLVPKDPYDEKPVIVEIRPAAGGDEAGLFAAELFRMFKHRGLTAY
jgi:peptide chain release factor 1